MARTVFLTGITGFIAKHIALQLLEAGDTVIGSTRSLDRADEVRNALRPALSDAKALDKRLRFVALDLTADDGWSDAMVGADALIHTASPFPMSPPKHEDALVRPAVDGARRALVAAKAADITRVVLTSSAVAVMNTDLPAGRDVYDEGDWTDPAHPGATAYAKSKTMAERAAWAFVETDAPRIGLTTINPGLVLGTPLDRRYGTSIRVIERVLSGQDPMLPRIGFPVVDVQDVAAMHVRALNRPDSVGKRYLAASDFMWFRDIARVLQREYPKRKITIREAPDFLIRVIALVDPAARGILPTLGRVQRVSNTRAVDELGIAFRRVEDSVRATARFLINEARA